VVSCEVEPPCPKWPDFGLKRALRRDGKLSRTREKLQTA
jgi:hypothetical protein